MTMNNIYNIPNKISFAKRHAPGESSVGRREDFQAKVFQKESDKKGKGGYNMGKMRRSELVVLRGDPGGAEDKRVFCRLGMDGVPMRFKDLKVGERGDGICQDISGGGAGLFLRREMRPKTPLEMWFDLADGLEPMHLLGRVVWSRQYPDGWHAGITFDRQKLMSMSRILKK